MATTGITTEVAAALFGPMTLRAKRSIGAMSICLLPEAVAAITPAP